MHFFMLDKGLQIRKPLCWSYDEQVIVAGFFRFFWQFIINFNFEIFGIFYLIFYRIVTIFIEINI